MAEQFTFRATRGLVQDYGDPDAVLKVVVLGTVVVDNDNPDVAKIDDVDADEVTGGTYARQVLDGVLWDTSGEIVGLRAADITITGLDLDPATTGTAVVIVDDHPNPARIGDLVAGVRYDPVTVVGEFPIEWADGFLATIDDTVSAVAKVAGVRPDEDGNIPTDELADQLTALLGGGGGTPAGAAMATETGGVADVESLIAAGRATVLVDITDTLDKVNLGPTPSGTVGRPFVLIAAESTGAIGDVAWEDNSDNNAQVIGSYDLGDGTYAWLVVPQTTVFLLFPLDNAAGGSGGAGTTVDYFTKWPDAIATGFFDGMPAGTIVLADNQTAPSDNGTWESNGTTLVRTGDLPDSGPVYAQGSQPSDSTIVSGGVWNLRSGAWGMFANLGSTGGGAVDSVNGQTGTVVLDAGDVGADVAGAAAAAQAAAIAASQPVDSDLTAIAALATDAFGRDLLTKTTAASVRSYLGLVLGTDVQAFHANLAAFAGLSLVPDRVPYASGTGTLALATFTSFGRTLTALSSYAALLAGLSGQAGADFSLNSHKLTSVADPTADQDAATLAVLRKGRPRLSFSSGNWGMHAPESVEPSTNSSQAGNSAQVATWWPCYVDRAALVTPYIYCWTLESGAALRFALWTFDPSTCKPGTLVEDLGTVSGSSTGAKTGTTATQTVAGWFFLAVWSSNHTAVRWARATTYDPQGVHIFGMTALAAGNRGFAWRATGLDYSSTWNATLPTLGLANSTNHPNEAMPNWSFT